MSVHSSAYFWNGDTLVLHIFLQPRASQNEWTGRHNGWISLRITVAPIDNHANLECVKFISKSLKTEKTNVKVIRGQTSRLKIIKIHQPDPKSWEKNLEGLDN